MYNEFRRTDMKNLKKMLVLCSLALVFTAVLADASYAESVMETGMKKALVLFQHIKTIIFVVGAFGLIGIAFQAIFGKVIWTWCWSCRWSGYSGCGWCNRKLRNRR